MDSEMFWYNDGHKIQLTLDKASVLISSIICPHDNEPEAACQGIVKDSCVVSYFLSRYGFDCNVGIAPVQNEMEIAWTIVGQPEYDYELCQVWVIPTSDEFFAAWIVSQQTKN